MPNNAKKNKSPPRRKSPARNGVSRPRSPVRNAVSRPRSPVRNGIGRPRSPKRRNSPNMHTMRPPMSRTVLLQNMFGGRRANVNIHNLASFYNYLRTTSNGLNVYMRKR